MSPTAHTPTSRPTAPRLALIAFLAAAIGLAIIVTDTRSVGATPNASAGWGVTEEQQFVGLINELRASKGLGTVSIDIELVTQARSWSQTMADRGSIFHSSDLSAGISANWRKLGENVGVGGTVTSLFNAFVASPTHYENLVDPSFTRIGIGVVWSGDRMFTAHRFMAIAPQPAATSRPDRVVAVPPATPAATPESIPAPQTATAAAAAGSAVDEPVAAAPRTPPPADPATVTAGLAALAGIEPTRS